MPPFGHSRGIKLISIAGVEIALRRQRNFIPL